MDAVKRWLCFESFCIWTTEPGCQHVPAQQVFQIVYDLNQLNTELLSRLLKPWPEKRDNKTETLRGLTSGQYQDQARTKQSQDQYFEWLRSGQDQDQCQSHNTICKKIWYKQTMWSPKIVLIHTGKKDPQKTTVISSSCTSCTAHKHKQDLKSPSTLLSSVLPSINNYTISSQVLTASWFWDKIEHFKKKN